MKHQKKSPLKRCSDGQISALYLLVFTLSVILFLLAFISFFSSVIKCLIFGISGIVFLFISSRFWGEIKRRVKNDNFTESSPSFETIDYGFESDMLEVDTHEKKYSPSHAKPSNRKQKYIVLIGSASVIVILGLWIAYGQGIFFEDVPVSADGTIKDSDVSDASNTSDTSTSLGNALDIIGDVEVENQLFNVTLTVPADFVGEITQDQLNEAIAEGVVYSAVLNGDGSVTYKMSKSQHKDLLDSIAAEINDSLAEIIASEDFYTITDIKANDSFTKFTVTTISTEITMQESFSALSLYTYGGMYAIFSGKEADNIHVDFVNADTGEIISSADSKDLGT